ncbi:MAG TPA: RodZ domain-containing protein [Thermoanaerobaculia bacterium]
MTEHESTPARSELASFGDELRREREIRGISLKEIADATKISKRFLEAIERNDHKNLPAPVFTRGFVREYARYLGLNHEDIVNRYNFAAAGDERTDAKPANHPTPAAMPQHPSEIARPKPKKGIPPAIARVDRNVFFTIFIVAALAAVTWWAIRYKRAQNAEAAAAETVAAPVAPARPAETATEPAAPPVNGDMLRLVIDVTEKSWVKLQADGKTVVNDELNAGDHRTFEAKENFVFVSIGNAAGVTLTLNEAKLPPLGENGEVLKNYKLDREDLVQHQTIPERNDT